MARLLPKRGARLEALDSKHGDAHTGGKLAKHGKQNNRGNKWRWNRSIR